MPNLLDIYEGTSKFAPTQRQVVGSHLLVVENKHLEIKINHIKYGNPFCLGHNRRCTNCLKTYFEISKENYIYTEHSIITHQVWGKLNIYCELCKRYNFSELQYN
jgi:hypothetical protein